MPRRLLLISLLICLLLVSPVAAREILSDENCLVDYDEIVEGSLFALCETLLIHGTVNGDVYAATIRTDIDGNVNGSIYIAAAQMNITGIISEDIHFGGIVLQLNPPPSDETIPLSSIGLHRISRSLKSLSLSTTLYANTMIEDGIFNFGYQLISYGNVDDEINFWGSTLVIEGAVAGNVYATVGDPSSDSSQIETLLIPLQLDLSLQNPGLIVGDSASILGDLDYSGPSSGQISSSAVTGATNYTSSLIVLTTLDEPGAFNLYLDQFWREFSPLVVIGVLALFSMSKALQTPLGNLRVRPFASLAVGMLGFLLSFPIVMIVLLLSLTILGFFYLIGLQAVVVAVGIVLGMVNIAGISVFYFVAIFGARTLVGLALGRVLLRGVFRRNDLDDNRWMPVLALLLGVAFLSLLTALPFPIGLVINALALFLGLGAILNVLISSFRRLRDTSPSPAPVWYAPSPAITRERHIGEVPAVPQMIVNPRMEEQTKPPLPGNQNLPEGFDWSFFED